MRHQERDLDATEKEETMGRGVSGPSVSSRSVNVLKAVNAAEAGSTTGQVPTASVPGKSVLRISDWSLGRRQYTKVAEVCGEEEDDAR